MTQLEATDCPLILLKNRKFEKDKLSFLNELIYVIQISTQESKAHIDYLRQLKFA